MHVIPLLPRVPGPRLAQKESADLKKTVGEGGSGRGHAWWAAVPGTVEQFQCAVLEEEVACQIGNG